MTFDALVSSSERPNQKMLEQQATVPPPPTELARVLVVDDNVDAADSLAAVLSMLGYSTVVVYDGASALRALQARTVDMAFVDIGLPGMNGLELAAKIRALPGHAHIKLIAFSGYSQASDRILSNSAGFNEHLVKPIDISRLERVLAAPSTPTDGSSRAPRFGV